MPFLEDKEWRPGSFTKNFTWGKAPSGLRQLYLSIRAGFDNKLEDVSRSTFRKRVSESGRIDFIPANFFLFNRRRGGVDWLVADELVFQAISFPYSSDFDKLALFAFLFSRAGFWKGAQAYQRYPSLWASHYVSDMIGRNRDWDASRSSADDIEQFILADSRYHAAGARKVAANLNYILRLGKLSQFKTTVIERWWVDAMFLALDRIILDRQLSQLETNESEYPSLLSTSGFFELSGPPILDKNLATQPLSGLYIHCGGLDRFSDDVVRERTVRIPDLQWLAANDPQPVGAVERTNLRVLKTIPRSCAIIARYLGFDIIDHDELVNFDLSSFVKRRAMDALQRLNDEHVLPIMSAADLDELTRGE